MNENGNGRKATTEIEALPALLGQSEVERRLMVLRRRWPLLVACGVLSAGVAFWGTRHQRPVYQAEATVQRKPERSPLEGLTAAQTPSDVASEMEIIRSGSVLTPVAESAGVAAVGATSVADAVPLLQSRLSLEQIPGTNLIRIAYRHPDAQTAARIVNLTAASYRAFSAAKARAEATRRRIFVAGQLGQVADSLRAAQSMLAQYQSSSRLLDPKDAGSAVTTSLMQAQTDQRTLRFQAGLLQTLLDGLRSGKADDALRRVAVLGRDVVPGVGEMYTHLQSLESDRSKLTASRFGYTREGPNVQVLDSLIAATQEDIRSATEQSLGGVRGRLQAADARVDQLQSQEAALPQMASEFERLRQRVDAAQQTYDQLASKYYEAQVAEAVEGGKVEVVDPALVPRTPTHSNRGRLIILALLAGTAVGIGLAFLLEHLDRKVRGTEEAERATALKVLAGIPDLRESAEDEVPAVLADDKTGGAEAFRVLRTALHFARAERPRVIAVTSAAPNEGKSVTACNLAVVIARQGLDVLLVDADLRRPTIHRRLELEQTPGLSDVLVRASSPEAAIVQGPVPGLKVLTSGTEPPNPAELLASSRFRVFLETMREQFDCVVLDTPPVLAVTDVAAMAPALEGVLVVARAEFTDRVALAHAAAQLRQADASVLGLVLNCIPKKTLYGYSRKYGYYGYSYTQYYSHNGHRKRSPVARGLRELRKLVRV